MTRRERVIQALNHCKTDYVPYQIDFTTEEYQKAVKFTGDKNFASKINNHLFLNGYGKMEQSKENPNHYIDIFGVIWNREKDKDIGVVENLLIPDADNYNYVFPEIDENALRDGIKYIINFGEDKFLGFGIGFSLFERAWTLRGMENLLCDMVENEQFVHRLFSDICEWNLKIIKIINEYAKLDCLYFGDDWGQQRGLIMGAKYWREYIKPYLKKMYAAAKSKNKYILQHSCGDIEEIYSDLIELRLDVHNTFQPEIYNIEKVKQIYGDKLSFWGGISTQHVLAHGTPTDVKNETIRLIKTMGVNSGGYIAAPTHGVPHDVPIENLLAMLEVFENQSEYIK